MGAIFLSYAREDRACAERLARVLEAAGHQVWWDRRLDGGEEYSAEIEAALDKSDVVVVAWSKASVTSRWVRDEAAAGGDKGRLVPVSIDGSHPPMGFRQFHTIDLAGWKAAKRDPRTAELLRSVAGRLQGRKEPAPESPAEPRRFQHILGRPLLVAAAVILLLAAASAAYFLLRDGSRPSAPVKPTIALLPFTTASPDGELRQIAAQARESVAHTFSQSGLPVKLVDSGSQDGPSRADFMIAGDVSRTDDKVVATVRLNEAAHGVTVFSHRFEAAREEVRDFPDRIGAQMAGNLTWSFPLLILDRRRPIEPALIAELLQGADFTAGLENLQKYQVSKRVAAKAPDLQVAQVSAAFDTAFVLAELPRNERAGAVAEARLAASRAKALGAGFGDIHAAWCMLHSETRMAECEDQVREGKRVDPDAPFLNTFLSHTLRSVGRFDEAADLARLAHAHDIYVPTKIAWVLKSLESSRESEAAQNLYSQGVRWWPEFKPMFVRNRLWGLIGRGDFDAILRLEQAADAGSQAPNYKSSAALVGALKAKSPAGARRACSVADDFWLNVRCMIALSILGDLDGAYAIADKLYPRRVGRTPADTERIWLDEPDGDPPLEFITSPAAAPLRRDPRYLQLAQRVGLLAYWRSGRLPDFCRKQPEPICSQFRKQR